MATMFVSLPAMLCLVFGVILVFDGLPAVGVALIAVSAVLWTIWWRMWERRT